MELGAKPISLDKLNRRAACIIEGRSIGAVELKSTLGWPSLQAHRIYLKLMHPSPRNSALVLTFGV